MLTKFSKILKIISYVFISFAVILAFLLTGMRLFGFKIFTILSPSMEPKYPTGAIIYVKEIPTHKLSEGDVITFRLTDNMTATHRIIEIVSQDGSSDNIRFRTKGDNNDEADTALVEPDSVLGKVYFSIPLLGFLASYIQSPPGLYIAIGFAVFLILLVLLSDFSGGEKKEENEEISS